MDVTIACLCPPKADGAARHEADTVTLPEVLDFRTTLTIRQTIRFEVASGVRAGESMTLAEMTALMAEAYLLHCISAWSLVDDKGKPVPVSQTAVRERLLLNYEAAEKVGDAADALYSDKVVLPLLTGASSSSSPTPTKRRTSRTTNGSTPRKPSKRSSTTTTPMVVTGPMAASPGGVSSSSLT
jgi:hypothetical protein